MNVSDDILIWTGNSNHHKVTASDFPLPCEGLKYVKRLTGALNEFLSDQGGPQGTLA